VAKLNGRGFKLVKKLINPRTGLVIAIRSDKQVLRRSPYGYKKYVRIKDGVSIDMAIKHLMTKCGYKEAR